MTVIISPEGKKTLDYAIGYNEPSLTDWLIEEAYQSQLFKLSSFCGKGGFITETTSVTFGEDARFIIRTEPGFIIDSVTINGAKTDLSVLETNANDPNEFSYTFKNVISDSSISVTFSNAGQKSAGQTFMRFLIKLFAAAASVFLLAATGFLLLAPTRRRKEG